MESQNITPVEIKAEAEKLLVGFSDKSISPNLEKLLSTQEKLKERKSTEIKFSAPVLKQGDNGVIFKNTINVLQGQQGSHKSRLAELICAALLKLHDCDTELLGFNRTNYDANYTVVYVDTERNLTEQFPYALQSIQLKAGYKITDHPPNFKYISLLEISRIERFKALNEYLEYIRKSSNSPVFIVLDVSTDCIEDFNRTDKSMELIDLMNMTINQYDVIFLCLIHENPKTDKARGHFGTELMNKASTAMQVGFEKDSQQNDTDIIRVKYLKCRSSARYTPFYFKYSLEEKGLVLADKTEVNDVINGRKHKVLEKDFIDFVELYMGDGTPIKRTDFLAKLKTEFDAGIRTLETRITEIIASDSEIFNEQGQLCRFTKEAKDKLVYYCLKPIENN